MEKEVPEILRAYADALEDPRRADNVESCTRFPELDQKMLLALNGASEEELPNAGVILGQLQQRLISVTTSDRQSASLGIFYTNRNPFIKNKPRLTVGIFPRYAETTDYQLRPKINLYSWERRGELTLTDESAQAMDPVLLPNPQGLDFMLFKKSPFREVEPYMTVLPDAPQDYSRTWPKLVDEALERNVIERALWIAKVKHWKPALFKQEGFSKFMSENRHDPRYRELYTTFKDTRSYYATGSLEY